MRCGSDVHARPPSSSRPRGLAAPDVGGVPSHDVGAYLARMTGLVVTLASVEGPMKGVRHRRRHHRRQCRRHRAGVAGERHERPDRAHSVPPNRHHQSTPAGWWSIQRRKGVCVRRCESKARDVAPRCPSRSVQVRTDRLQSSSAWTTVRDMWRCVVLCPGQLDLSSLGALARSSRPILPRHRSFSSVGSLAPHRRTGGVRPFYRGFGITFLGSAPSACLYFTTYEVRGKRGTCFDSHPFRPSHRRSSGRPLPIPHPPLPTPTSTLAYTVGEELVARPRSRSREVARLGPLPRGDDGRDDQLRLLGSD